MCLAHCSDKERSSALKLVSETGTIDACGTPITSSLLEQVLAATPRGENGEPLIKGCRFDRATFQGTATFDRATFQGTATFDRATFSGDATFDQARFGGYVRFSKATFNGNVKFNKSVFEDEATFGLAVFRGSVAFDEARFGGGAWFSAARFGGGAWFAGAAFGSGAWFAESTFQSTATFDQATFSGDATFDGTTFKHSAGFDGVRFEQARQIGPLLAYRGLVLDNAQFAQPVQIEISSTGVCCRRARFPGGVQFRLRWARVVLDDTDLAAPSVLAGIPRLSSEELARREEQIARAWQRLLKDEISVRPQLLSLRRADVAGLGLSNVSAADCRFAGAHNLDKLRLESDVSFATAPSPVGLGGRGGGGREVIAEERAWRVDPQRADRSRRRWVDLDPRWPGWLGDKPDVLDPGQIAGLCRALRKGREDVKDEPGAADFYYGEMEMRRHRPVNSRNAGDQSSATVQGRVERGILTAYWLVSGYGLRASRALATLLLILALATVGFVHGGFASSTTTAYQQVTLPSGTRYEPREIRGAPPGWAEAATYSVQSTTSLLRTPTNEPLTESGRIIEIMIRLLGPVLLGLALLALRGRVKR